MRNSWISISVMACFLLAVHTSCGNQPKSLNPNGDSELAILMREMYDDGMKTKQQLLDGEAPEVHVKYKQIHTAQVTESLKLNAEAFKANAAAYETAMDSFIATDASNKVAAYQLMVNACMNCHQMVCPGPKVKIQHMYFTKEELASLATEK